VVGVATAACPGSTAKNNREITQAILDNQGFEDAVWIRALDKMIADASIPAYFNIVLTLSGKKATFK
jgi:hypothetical protein